MLTEMYKRGDSIALTKGLLIAARRLSGDGLALSVGFADTSPKGRGSGVSVRLSFVQPLSLTSFDKARLRLPASASLPLASRWPLPQQLLPASAAGGGRRRCP